MKALRTVMVSAVVALVAGCAATADAQPRAGARGSASTVARTGQIAVTGVTFKTDLAAVYSSHPDGSAQRKVPLPATLLPEATAWSPDGKHLAVDAGGVFTVGADGRGFRQLTPSAMSTGSTVSWSPDGKWIAFTGDAARGYYSAAYVIGPGGTGLHQVLTPFDVVALAWGPGGRIAFLGWPHRRVPSAVQPLPQPAGVWTADASGAHARLVAGPARSPSASAWIYGWSPDGRWVLFGSGTSLRMAPSAGGRARALLTARSPSYVAAAAWSPDGSTIIAAKNPGVPWVAPVRYYRIHVAGGRAAPVSLPPMRYVSGLAWNSLLP